MYTQHLLLHEFKTQHTHTHIRARAYIYIYIGMTIVGGMLQLNGGLYPTNTAESLAALAVVLSAVNLAGGTIVTKKMLDMFKRPDDPPEFNNYYLAPGAVAMAGSGALILAGATTPATLAPILGMYVCIIFILPLLKFFMYCFPCILFCFLSCV